MSDAPAERNEPTVEVESIWLTKPSVKPLVLAVCMLGALIGLFGFRALLYVSLIAAAITTIAWIAENRSESDELPLT